VRQQGATLLQCKDLAVVTRVVTVQILKSQFSTRFTIQGGCGADFLRIEGGCRTDFSRSYTAAANDYTEFEVA